MTTSEPQRVLNSPYQRKRFKKLIPELLERDFKIPLSVHVKNGILNVNINQGRKYFSFSVSKLSKNKQKGTYKASYRTTHNSFIDYDGKDVLLNTVTEIYAWVKEKMISDGLLNKEELMVQDIIE